MTGRDDDALDRDSPAGAPGGPGEETGGSGGKTDAPAHSGDETGNGAPPAASGAAPVGAGASALPEKAAASVSPEKSAGDSHAKPSPATPPSDISLCPDPGAEPNARDALQKPEEEENEKASPGASSEKSGAGKGHRDEGGKAGAGSPDSGTAFGDAGERRAGKALFGPVEPESRSAGGTLKAWVQASRPSFYITTLYPLFLGFIAARNSGGGKPGILIFALILVASFLVHLATNIANDYFEHSGGVDTKKSIGGSRVIQEGKISPGAIKKAIALCYAAAFVMAIAIVGRNWALWGMVVFAALSSFFYVAPPVKYGHRALGELMVFLNMGVIMTAGTFMALTGGVTGEVIALSLPGAFMVANVLYYQSLPEIETDAEAGKTTLAGLLGKERAALVELLWWPLVWLLVAVLVMCGKLSLPALLCLLAVPVHAVSMRRIWKAGDWLALDSSGWLVKILYVWTGLAVLAGALWDPFPAAAAPPPPVAGPARPGAVPAAPPPAAPASG
ncbi:MAG: UbiA family prenyltransferase, partial [Deltaproteobacteria bacterium]|nr:UbiA family prenyltransferase [Deltaproteobacteria bacterium]